MASLRGTPTFNLPLTPRLLAALLVGSVFVSFVAAHLSQTVQDNRAKSEQSARVRAVASDLASQAAPLLESGDDLRLAVLGTAAARFGDCRVLLLNRAGEVRVDTGVALGGRKVQLLTDKGAFTREIDAGRIEHLAPASAVSGVVGEVRIRYPALPESAAFPWSVFGGSLLACLSLLAIAGVICNQWMRHIREAVEVAQGMSHGDLTARCERSAAGVIRDLQDSLHDMGTVLGDGVQQVQRSFLELAHQTVEILERRGATGHSDRTCAYSMLLAGRLGLTPEEWKDVETAARLHDLGEVFEPPATVTQGESEAALAVRLRRIPQRGAELLSGMTHLRRVTEIVRHYRERFDGNGSPAGLHGERIPLGARILAIADAFDQLTTVAAVGEQPMSWSEALEALRIDRGEMFDPWLVDLFEEEIRRSPASVEETNTVMISTSGVMPYKVVQEGRAEEFLEQNSFDAADEWEQEELEVEEDEFLHLSETAGCEDWMPADESPAAEGER